MLPIRNSLESKPLAAIVGPGACRIFVLAWSYYSALLSSLAENSRGFTRTSQDHNAIGTEREQLWSSSLEGSPSDFSVRIGLSRIGDRHRESAL